MEDPTKKVEAAEPKERIFLETPAGRKLKSLGLLTPEGKLKKPGDTYIHAQLINPEVEDSIEREATYRLIEVTAYAVVMTYIDKTTEGARELVSELGNTEYPFWSGRTISIATRKQWLEGRWKA